jgi:hypothetical protein
MIAFDTNLLVRAVVADEPSQVAIVRASAIHQVILWKTKKTL